MPATIRSFLAPTSVTVQRRPPPSRTFSEGAAPCALSRSTICACVRRSAGGIGGRRFATGWSARATATMRDAAERRRVDLRRARCRGWSRRRRPRAARAAPPPRRRAARCGARTGRTGNAPRRRGAILTIGSSGVTASTASRTIGSTLPPSASPKPRSACVLSMTAAARARRRRARRRSALRGIACGRTARRRAHPRGCG